MSADDYALAAEYRSLANKAAVLAASAEDAELRIGHLNIAATYLDMAQHLEARGKALARAAEMPTQPEGAAIAAAKPPPPEEGDGR